MAFRDIFINLTGQQWYFMIVPAKASHRAAFGHRGPARQLLRRLCTQLSHPLDVGGDPKHVTVQRQPSPLVILRCERPDPAPNTYNEALQ